MPDILCFGDSNTWGYVPGTAGERFASDERWAGVMRHTLGDGYAVVEEGLNARTTVWQDPMRPNRCGKEHLPILLESHAPLDLTIIALGVNDLKHYFGLTAIDIALGAQTLGELAMASGLTREVALICPVLPVEAEQPFGHKFDGAIERAAGLADAFREAAREIGCLFFDANTAAVASPIDGVHLDEANHRKLGEAVGRFVINSLANG